MSGSLWKEFRNLCGSADCDAKTGWGVAEDERARDRLEEQEKALCVEKDIPSAAEAGRVPESQVPSASFRPGSSTRDLIFIVAAKSRDEFGSLAHDDNSV
jgi:hypothetical protein